MYPYAKFTSSYLVMEETVAIKGSESNSSLKEDILSSQGPHPP